MTEIIHRHGDDVQRRSEFTLERAKAIDVGVLVASVRRDVRHQTQRAVRRARARTIDADERGEDIGIDHATIFPSPERGDVARSGVKRRERPSSARDAERARHAHAQQRPRARVRATTPRRRRKRRKARR